MHRFFHCYEKIYYEEFIYFNNIKIYLPDIDISYKTLKGTLIQNECP